MFINHKWDYPGMEQCAKKLDTLFDAAITNKKKLDAAFESLDIGVQAVTGKAFLQAYSENVASIQLFAQALEAEARLLRDNSNAMQAEDERIAGDVRRIFIR